MLLDAYIGDKDGNPKRRVSPFLPNGSSAFWEIRDRIQAGEFDGENPDGLGMVWVTYQTKVRILDFVDEVYRDDPRLNKEALASVESDRVRFGPGGIEAIYRAYEQDGEAALRSLSDGPDGYDRWMAARSYCELRELREFVDSLDNSTMFPLIASEL